MMTSDNPKIQALYDQESIKEKLIRKLHKKVLEHFENHTLLVSGDTRHTGIKCLVERTFANGDHPRDYNFQDVDHYKKQCLKILQPYFDGDGRRLSFIDLDQQDIENALNGTGSIVLSDRLYNNGCQGCEQKIKMEVTSDSIHFVAGEASICESLNDCSIDFYFPSGKIHFADWLDLLGAAKKVNLIKEVKESINYAIGIVKTSQEYAKHQVAHFFVGNSSPGLYVDPQTNDLMIGRVDRYDEDADEYVNIEGLSNYKKLGHFCTDLWWVTLLDDVHYQALLKRVLEKGGKVKEEGLSAQIKPGTYRFTPLYGFDPLEEGYHNEPVYVSAKYLGETDLR